MAAIEVSGAADRELAASAEATSLWAARRAELSIRELADVNDLGDVTELLRSIWGSTDDTGPPINRDLLRALALAGSYVAGAYDSSGLRGALVGFLGDHEDGPHLHSHILGVRPSHSGRGVGFALKLHQRAWAVARNHSTVEWTFDPLVRRNAFFNLTKLGADLHRYHVNLYGVMGDAQNGPDDSDRVMVRWNLRSERVMAAAAGAPAQPMAKGQNGPEAHVALAVDADGGPLLRPAVSAATTLLLLLPDDIVDLRRAQPQLARRWRRALRDALTTALATGYQCDGVTRAGEYVLTRRTPPP